MPTRALYSILGHGWLAIALLALSPAAASAAVITWGSETDISADTDVSTTGTLIRAFHFGTSTATNATVNGVLFEAFNVSVGAIGNFSTTSDLAGNTSSASAPFSGLSPDYREVLGAAAFHSSSTSFTLTMSGLTVGQSYLFQTWVNDSVGSFRTGFSVTVSAGDSAGLDRNTTNAEGGLGQYVIGTFVADTATQTIAYSNDEIGGLVNAFQLRQLDTATSVVPEPASAVLWTLMGLTGSALMTRRRQVAMFRRRGE
jgi:hypothetical protein